MIFRDWGHSLFVQPRVLHEVSGRIRFHVPFLKRMYSESAALVDMIARLLTIPEGIESVTPNRISGNVLVHYNPDIIAREEVLEFFQALLRACAGERHLLLRASKASLDTLEQELSDWLRAALAQRLCLKPNIRIDHYVRVPE